MNGPQRLSSAELLATIGMDNMSNNRTDAEESARILRSFEHFTPTPEQVERIIKIRAAMAHAAEVCLESIQPGGDLDRAIATLQDASRQAIAGIVLELNQLRRILAKTRPFNVEE